MYTSPKQPLNALLKSLGRPQGRFGLPPAKKGRQFCEKSKYEKSKYIYNANT